MPIQEDNQCFKQTTYVSADTAKLTTNLLPLCRGVGLVRDVFTRDANARHLEIGMTLSRATQLAILLRDLGERPSLTVKSESVCKGKIWNS